MNDGYILPIRPAPISGESFLGYLQRLAEANSCDHVQWIADMAEIDPRQASIGDAGLGVLADLCLAETERLDRMRYRKLDEGYLSFMGHRVRSQFIRNRSPKVCGACLAEARYHRAVWDLAFAGVCPDHRMKLIQSCQDCNRTFRWNRPSVARCSCHADLAMQRGEYVSKKEAEAVRTILRRFSVAATPGPVSSQRSDAQQLPSGEFVELLLFLGRNASSLETGLGQSGRTLDREDLALVLKNGLDASREWPGRFHILLDQLRNVRGYSSEGVSLQARFGQIYKSIAKLDHVGWGGLVRDAFRSYLRSNPDIPFLSGADLVEGLETDRDYVALPEAATILGVSQRVFRRMIDRSADGSIRSVGRGGKRLLHREDIQTLGQTLADTINYDELRRRLGVGSRTAIRMVAGSGLFAMREREEVGGKRAAAVVASDVEDFFSRLDAMCTEMVFA